MVDSREHIMVEEDDDEDDPWWLIMMIMMIMIEESVIVIEARGWWWWSDHVFILYEDSTASKSFPFHNTVPGPNFFGTDQSTHFTAYPGTCRWMPPLGLKAWEIFPGYIRVRVRLLFVKVIYVYCSVYLLIFSVQYCNILCSYVSIIDVYCRARKSLIPDKGCTTAQYEIAVTVIYVNWHVYKTLPTFIYFYSISFDFITYM